MREKINKLRLHALINRRGNPPPPRVKVKAAVNRSEAGVGIYRRCRGRAVRSTCGADKVEGIAFLSGARWRLLADVIRVVDRQVRALAAHVANLGSRVPPELLLHRQVP